MTAAERQSYIGGSDLGDILQIAPYGCRLRCWYRKRGIDLVEIDSEHMRRGRFGEEAAAKEYERVTGRKVMRHTVRRRADLPDYHGGHIDRHIVAFDDRGPGVLEIKCPGQIMFRQIKREGLSQAYVAQLQWYMYLTGWRWGSYAVMHLDSWEMIHFDLERDDELIGLLVREAEDFWRLVENGPQPDKIDPPGKACARCEYREKCHGAQELPPFDGEIIRDDSLAPLMAEYREAKQIVDEATELLDGVKERIRAAMGERQCVDTIGGRIYWRQQERRTIDARKLRAKHPEIAAQFERVSKFRTLKIYER